MAASTSKAMSSTQCATTPSLHAPHNTPMKLLFVRIALGASDRIRHQKSLVRGDRSARPRRQRPAGCITRLTRRVRDLLTVDPHGAAGPVEGHHIARDRHDPLHDEAELGFHALALAIE